MKGMKFLAWGANFVFATPPKTIASRNWLFIMKLSCLFIFSFLMTGNLLIAGNGYAQSLEDTRVTIYLRGEPIRNAMRQIEKQTSFRFAYVESQVAAYDKIYLPRQKRSLLSTLQLLLINTGLKFIVNGNTIVILPKEEGALQLSGNPDN